MMISVYQPSSLTYSDQEPETQPLSRRLEQFNCLSKKYFKALKNRTRGHIT